MIKHQNLLYFYFTVVTNHPLRVSANLECQNTIYEYVLHFSFLERFIPPRTRYVLKLSSLKFFIIRKLLYEHTRTWNELYKNENKVFCKCFRVKNIEH